MPKNKRPVPRKSSESPEEKEEALTQQLCDLAIALSGPTGQEPTSDLPKHEADLQRTIKKFLNQKNDDVLYESLECANYAGGGAYQLLRERIEAAAEVVLFRRDDGSTSEVNAFVVPLLVRTVGGLDSEQSFEDQEAFDLLTTSFKQAQLESPDATVVLINHAYHPDEIDSITYSDLHEMVRDAFTSMTVKKIVASTSIERSMRGWPENTFGAEDSTVELRFLLGFSLKAAEDAFYRIPENESAADAYFDARAARFQQWAEQAAPWVKRCLATDGREIDVHFLYQDLFHGGKEQGIAEYFMLQMMSELSLGLEQHGNGASNVRAVIGPAEVDGDRVLRVNLYAHAGELIASSDKPIGFARDLALEMADACDALTTIGVEALSLATGFDANGQAIDIQPYQSSDQS